MIPYAVGVCNVTQGMCILLHTWYPKSAALQRVSKQSLQVFDGPQYDVT